MMEGNPHVEIAKSLSGESAIKYSTLAMVHEQRITNLIAYLNWIDTHNVSGGFDTYVAAREQIETGLGIR